MAARRVVIVGGGAAGDAAAFGLRKKGFDGEVLVISADLDRPYERPYLSKEYLRGEVELPKVYLHGEGDYSKEKIELLLGRRAVGGSLSDRRLALDDGAEILKATLRLVDHRFKYDTKISQQVVNGHFIKQVGIILRREEQALVGFRHAHVEVDLRGASL